MLNTKKITSILIPIAVLGLAGCATSQSMPDAMADKDMVTVSNFSKDSFDLDKLTCWDLATISEDDAGYAATLVYGYAQGKVGAASQTPAKIETALGQISQKCAGNPDMLLMSAFK